MAISDAPEQIITMNTRMKSGEVMNSRMRRGSSSSIAPSGTRVKFIMLKIGMSAQNTGSTFQRSLPRKCIARVERRTTSACPQQ